MSNPFKVGSKVKLRDDVLQRHARRIPPSSGYTPGQFQWRDTLRNLEGKVGKVSMLFEGSKHVNVEFESGCIGIDYTELEPLIASVRVHIEHDADCESPMEMDGQWTLYSFYNRHTTYKRPEDLGIEEDLSVHGKAKVRNIGLIRKLQVGLAFPLSHGSGDQWHITSLDGRYFDGILIWENKPGDMGAKTVEDRKRDASIFLKEYNAWADGSCYFYSIDKLDDEGEEVEGAIGDSCGGFIVADKTDAEYFFDCIGDAIPEGVEVEFAGEMEDLADHYSEVIRWLVDDKKFDVKERIVGLIKDVPQAKALWAAVCEKWTTAGLGVLLDCLEEAGKDVEILRPLVAV